MCEHVERTVVRTPEWTVRLRDRRRRCTEESTECLEADWWQCCCCNWCHHF